MRITGLTAGMALWLQAGESRQTESRQTLCEDYADRVLLVVNTASYCGYMPQMVNRCSVFRPGPSRPTRL